MNPGLCEQICLSSIDKIYFEKYNINDKISYSEKAEKLGILTIHISEIDTQETNRPNDKNEFVCTWSACGFQAEATDSCIIYLGTHEDDNDKYIKPNSKSRVRFFKELSMNIYQDSYCLDNKGNPIKYTGMIISHGETSRLGQYLSIYKNNKCIYAPTVCYVYKPCDRAIESLELLKENKYKPLDKNYVLELDDISNDGYDSVGVTIYFEDGSIYWAGTSISKNQVKKYKLYKSTPTTLQVSSSILACIKYMIKNNQEGLIDPEDLPSRNILMDAMPYLGNYYEKWINLKK